jgi:hypothetical protein
MMVVVVVVTWQAGRDGGGSTVVVVQVKWMNLKIMLVCKTQKKFLKKTYTEGPNASKRRVWATASSSPGVAGTAMAVESPLRLAFQAREGAGPFCEQNMHPKLAHKCEFGVFLLLLLLLLLLRLPGGDGGGCGPGDVAGG